jgi:hypothetical protein
MAFEEIPLTGNGVVIDVKSPTSSAVITDPKDAKVVTVAEERYAIPESAKMGIAGAAFLIVNKMIGTGSPCHQAHHLRYAS